ncbi:MAG: aminoglycoside phosphotransferase family protein [Myxococcota bacterium]
MNKVNPSLASAHTQSAVRLLQRHFSGWAPLRPARQSSAVVSAWATSAGPVHIKTHDTERKYVQEKQAYLRWSKAVRTPRLLDYSDADRALLMSTVRGQNGGADTLPLEAHRAAGRWLRCLHRIPVVDDDPLPWSEALQRRIFALQRRAKTRVDPAVVDRHLAPALGLISSAASMRRVPCHRDFEPGNWIYDGTHLTAIDFEHARLDAPAWDFTRMATTCWLNREAVREAFSDGYGPVDIDFWPWVEALQKLDTLSTLVWGLTHEAPKFIARARRSLQVADGDQR